MGAGAGLAGERSGLWREYLRAIRLVRPRVATVENVAALLDRGVGEVLRDLAESGYDAEWDCLPACAFGAPHRRDRIFIVAYPEREGLEGHAGNGSSGSGREKTERPVSAPRIFNAENNPANRIRVRPGDSAREWRIEPGVGRVAHGIPARVDRLKGLGNAIVPQIAEWIGRRIIEAEQGSLRSGG